MLTFMRIEYHDHINNHSSSQIFFISSPFITHIWSIAIMLATLLFCHINCCFEKKFAVWKMHVHSTSFIGVHFTFVRQYGCKYVYKLKLFMFVYVYVYIYLFIERTRSFIVN